MDEPVLRNWWTLSVRGLAAMVFGALACLLNDMRVESLMSLFGGYAIVDGALAIVAGLRSRRGEARWWSVLVEGLAGLPFGAVVLWTRPSALTLFYLVAAWALVRGIVELVASVRVRQVLRGEAFHLIAATASLTLGVAIAVMPRPTGGRALHFTIGATVLLSGLLLFVLGLRLREAAETPDDTEPRLGPALHGA